ncbi:MAG: hypothetical protein JWM16_4446 [Verrucomicrobiales bacterium]|nr:hypothetical protein [Verrucomicrobiales bacterium]
MASKQKPSNKEGQLLELLKRILPKTISDPKLVEKVYSACERELKAKVKVSSFEKFCEKCELPDLQTGTVAEVKKQFEDSFGKGAVTVKADADKEMLNVEVNVGEDTYTGAVKVRPVGEVQDEQEVAVKFIPFPVCLPSDTELVWALGRRENMTPDEGCIALTKLQDDFWASKTGQKLLRDRVDRSFPEFISRAPAKALTELGLKRHYKEPEPIKALRTLHPPEKKSAAKHADARPQAGA